MRDVRFEEGQRMATSPAGAPLKYPNLRSLLEKSHDWLAGLRAFDKPVVQQDVAEFLGEDPLPLLF